MPSQVDLLPSDGQQGVGNERPGLLAAGTLKEVGSLEDVLARWEERLPGAKVMPISALEGINTVEVRVVTQDNEGRSGGGAQTS